MVKMDKITLRALKNIVNELIDKKIDIVHKRQLGQILSNIEKDINL